MEKCGKAPAPVGTWSKQCEHFGNEDRMLGDRIREVADSLTVPAGNERQAVGNVFDLDIEWRRIEQVQSASREHSLPNPWRWP